MNYEHDEEWEWGSFISKDGQVTGIPPTPLTMMGGIAGLIIDILPSLPEGSLPRAKANAALKALGRHKTGFRGPSPEVGKATQFRPGQSGNPGGRPRAIISYWLRHELEALDPETQQEVAQRLVRVLVDKALAGDMRAIQVIADRVEGKPMQREDTDPAANEMRVVVEHIGGRPQSRS